MAKGTPWCMWRAGHHLPVVSEPLGPAPAPPPLALPCARMRELWQAPWIEEVVIFLDLGQQGQVMGRGGAQTPAAYCRPLLATCHLLHSHLSHCRHVALGCFRVDPQPCPGGLLVGIWDIEHSFLCPVGGTRVRASHVDTP